jgi:hypothetical protein
MLKRLQRDDLLVTRHAFDNGRADEPVTTSKKRLPDWLRLVLVAMLSAGESLYKA